MMAAQPLSWRDHHRSTVAWMRVLIEREDVSPEMAERLIGIRDASLDQCGAPTAKFMGEWIKSYVGRHDDADPCFRNEAGIEAARRAYRRWVLEA